DVDFPRLLLQAIYDRPFEAVDSWKVGVRSRWWWGDIDHLITRLRHSRAELNLGPDAPGWLRLTGQILLPRLHQRSDVFQLADPAPALRESRAWFQALLPP